MVDMQSISDGEFKFLLDYKDHDNKLGYSIAMTIKRAAAAAAVLFELFCFIGPPVILQSDNGREFSNQASDSKQMSLDDDIRDRCVSSKCLCS